MVEIYWQQNSSHPVHILLRGNYGIELSLFLEVVGQSLYQSLQAYFPSIFKIKRNSHFLPALQPRLLLYTSLTRRGFLPCFHLPFTSTTSPGRTIPTKRGPSISTGISGPDCSPSKGATVK